MSNYETINLILTAIGVIVTSAGFWLLYTTFLLQAETFKTQQMVSIIEQKKFLYEIRPAFELIDNSTYPPGSDEMHCSVKIILTNNFATSVKKKK